jgi:hypothetical protein
LTENDSRSIILHHRELNHGSECSENNLSLYNHHRVTGQLDNNGKRASQKQVYNNIKRY